MKQRRIRIVYNPRGVPVKRCCASCQFRMINMEGKRICEHTHNVVEQMDRCRKWRMREGLWRV